MASRAPAHARTRRRPPQTSERTDGRTSERTLRSPCTTTHRTNQRAQSQLSSSHHTADVADVADVAAVVSPWLLAACRANERTVHLSYVARLFARRMHDFVFTTPAWRNGLRRHTNVSSPHLTSPHCTDTACVMSTNSSCGGTHMPTLSCQRALYKSGRRPRPGVRWRLAVVGGAGGDHS